MLRCIALIVQSWLSRIVLIILLAVVLSLAVVFFGGIIPSVVGVVI